MTTNRLLIHPDVHDYAQRYNLQRKLDWTLLQLALNAGSSLIVKGTVGHELKWRRTPLQGNHYYLWWLPKTEGNSQTIYVRDIRLHDKNSLPLDFGVNDQYLEKVIDEVNPREEEQESVSQKLTNLSNGNNLSVCTVQGAPGCGKTVAIQYTIQDLWSKYGNRNILYVTYTRGLAEKAKEFFEAHILNENYVKVLTLQQLKNYILGKSGDKNDLELARAKFKKFFGSEINKPRLGNWKGHLDLLWTEIRAYILGMALPLEWQRDGLDYTIPRCTDGILNKKIYLDIRRQTLRNSPILEEVDMEKAYELAQVVKNESFFRDQLTAYQALETLVTHPNILRNNWGQNLDAIVIDEIQDFTLLEIALLTQLGKFTINRQPPIQFSFLAAGDESQILQPSGFDWGITKNYFGRILSTNNYPTDVQMSRQRRSPKRLAELIQDSQNLYRDLNIPTEIRPQSGFRMEIGQDGGDSNESLLLRCRIKNEEWITFFTEITKKYPDSAIIDLDDTLTKIVDRLPNTELIESSKPLIYKPRHIKGLDRKIIFLWGLDTSIQHIIKQQNGHSGQQHKNKLFALEARQVVDTIRVAISRSTHTLIAIEQSDSPNYVSLGLDEIDQVNLTKLFAGLANAHSEQDDFELIHMHWRNVEEHITRERFLEAEISAREARKILAVIDDQPLQTQQKVLEEKIRQAKTRQEIQRLLGNAEEYLEQKNFGEAKSNNEAARNLLTELKDNSDLSVLKDQIETQRNKINREENREEIQRVLRIARENITVKKDVGKTRKKLTRAEKLFAQMSDGFDIIDLKQEYQAIYELLEQRDLVLDEEAKKLWLEAIRAINNKKWNDTVKSFARAAEIRHSQGKKLSSEALLCLASRYEQVPPSIFEIPFGIEEDINRLMGFTEEYIKLLRETKTMSKNAARQFAEFWLDEIYKIIQNNNFNNKVNIQERFKVASKQIKTDGGTSKENLW